jgi:hypothetical protein
MQRNQHSQTKHDDKVKEIAQDFLKKGFRVKADLDGFERPGLIHGCQPDIIAFKDGQRKIVEVETEETVKSDRDLNQQQAFREEADNDTNTTFTRRVAR